MKQKTLTALLLLLLCSNIVLANDKKGKAPKAAPPEPANIFINGVVLTKYTTDKEWDPTFTGASAFSATQRDPSAKSYYYVTSPVQAKSDFLAATSIDGYGFTSSGALLKYLGKTQILAPNPLPAGTDSSYKFYYVELALDSSGTPQGNYGNRPLVDGASSAIVRKSNGAGVFFKDRMQFTVKGHGEYGQRVADDRVDSHLGNRHIDLYDAGATAAQIKAFGQKANQTITIPFKKAS